MGKVTNKTGKERLSIGWSVGTKLWEGRKINVFVSFNVQ